MDFNVTIKNENELMYARYLHDLYFKIVKPFNQRNQLELKKIYEPFNRFFYLLGLSTTWFAGQFIFHLIFNNRLALLYDLTFRSEY